jgi:uncharacterized protein YcfJ
MNKQFIFIGIGAIILVVGAAAAGAYISNEKMEITATEAPKKNSSGKKVSNNTSDTPWKNQNNNAAPVQQQAQIRCDDGNILGTAAGGVAGGVLGNQVGKGNGKMLATIGGALGGAYLGKQYIPLNGTTCQ